jgi:hypothetical protein
MNPEDIKRFNVYATYEPKFHDTDKYRLECFDGKKWEAVTHNGNELEYRNLIQIAGKVAQLLNPREYEYIRVISKDKPQDDDGNLEGIVLHKSRCKLVRSLSVKELKELTKALDVELSR